MIDWIVRVMETAGYAGIAFLMALENLFPPIPSEAIMSAGGFAAARGELSLLGVIAAGSAGTLIGTVPYYIVGRWVGTKRVRDVFERYGRHFGLKAKDVDRADAWFDRYNWQAVLLGRCVPGIRTFISIPAGTFEMAVTPFLVFTTIGTVIWNTLLAVTGYLLGDNWHRVEAFIDPISTMVMVAVPLIAMIWIFRRWQGRRSEGRT
ncbi:DedA family protein [Marinivivus vitaminiproducens]|uniref:DedA family protein n=1 Tax=Marinivivus vitaminiproducens TaxID=3035935 RepID=UPI0027A3D59F|nr:DedA family protein [Geminicoccaceae bacterium SCSIO 64248]